MITRSLLIVSSAALLAACSNQNTPTADNSSNPYGVPQSDPYGATALPPVTGDRNAPYQPLPNVAESGIYAPDSGPTPPPAPPADDIYGGLSPAVTPKPAATQPATAGTGTTVVVGPRDTLWGFSKKYGVSEASIRAANKMAPTDNNVRLGQKLIIPGN